MNTRSPDSEHSPPDRCGYVWPHEDLDHSQPRGCCYRETVAGADRCGWHARSDAITPADLEAVRAPAPAREETAAVAELLDGATVADTGVPGTDYERVALRGADLSGAPLRGIDLTGAALSGATLSGAYLKDTTLSGADLTGADLSDSYLIEADLSGADLSEADLSGALLAEADLSEADLTGVDLSGATVKAAVSDVTVRDTVVTDTEFVETELPAGGTVGRADGSETAETDTSRRLAGTGSDSDSGSDLESEETSPGSVWGWRTRLRVGAAAGLGSVVAGYLLALVVVVGFEERALLREQLPVSAGWVYYGAQLTSLRVTDPPDSDTGGAFDGVTQNIVTEQHGFLEAASVTLPAALYQLIPVVVFALAGAGLARYAGVARLRDGLVTGPTLVAGAVIPAAIGTVAFSRTIDGLTIGPPVVESVLRVGVAFPAVFGTTGALLWLAYRRLDRRRS